MTYLALARKWRPQTFSELVGQEHVSQAIINSLNQQRLHHAYLFTGTRGVGKTSIARLFAKSLNCEQGVSAEPCLRCDNCQSIEQGRFVDLIEVDAASRTGVEDTRQLLENTQYLPANGRYKVFLIDEVHMLSASSFNALLKTLEEPPSHVKFILATTDPQKVPVTVLSRCLQFHLRALTPSCISQHLSGILQAENFDFEAESLTLLADAANGSLRDALSLLDQALALGGTALTLTAVQSMLGYTRQNYALLLLQALAQRDAGEILAQCRAINEEGAHFNYVLQQIQRYLHELMLIQQVGSDHPLLAGESGLDTLAQRFSPRDVQLLYQIALKAGPDITLAPTPLIGFEVAMLRMLAFWPLPGRGQAAQETLPLATTAPPVESPSGTASKKPVKTEPGTAAPASREEGAVVEAPPEQTTENASHNMPRKEPAATQSAPTDPLPETKTTLSQADNSAEAQTCASQVPTSDHLVSADDWLKLVPRLGLNGFALNAAQNAVWKSTNGSEIVFAVNPGHVSLFTDAVKERLRNALGEYFQKKIKIRIVSEQLTTSTPAIHQQQQNEQELQAASTNLQQDAVFQTLKENFSANVIKKSIESL